MPGQRLRRSSGFCEVCCRASSREDAAWVRNPRWASSTWRPGAARPSHHMPGELAATEASSQGEQTVNFRRRAQTTSLGRPVTSTTLPSDPQADATVLKRIGMSTVATRRVGRQALSAAFRRHRSHRHDLLFAGTSTQALESSAIRQHAASLPMDMNAFENCVTGTAGRVSIHVAQATELGCPAHIHWSVIAANRRGV
jgi:hypothetical protein